MSSASARTAVFVLAFALAAGIAYDLWRIPIQVSDSLTEILEAQQSPSVTASFLSTFSPGAAYLRPLRIAQIKAIFDLAYGHYTWAYRGFHVVLLVALFWLFARALHVESAADVAAATFALTVLAGLHTFLAFVREAFPINHFLEIAVLCLVALNLAQSQGGLLIDAAAAAVFVVAALTLESGLLVWVVLAAAWISGLRGVSWRGLTAVTLLLIVYAGMRVEYVQRGGPSLAERNSGFLLERLEPEELHERFGDAPLVFYAYNVGASVLSVLLSEPQAGVFVAVRAWQEGDVPPRAYLAVASSFATTALIAWWLIGRWRRCEALDRPARVGLVAGAVVAASAVLSFAYTKDEIVSTAGAFYALAAYGAARALVSRAMLLRRSPLVIAVSICCLLLSSAWAVRGFGVHHVLRRQAFKVRNDWAFIDRHFTREQRPLVTADARALVDRLQAEALHAKVPNSQLLSEWQNRWFGD